MADQARVASIEALERFRSDLIRYVETARAALGEVSGEVNRTRQWLDGDRTSHWTREWKQRGKRLEAAEQELYSARLRDPSAAHALQKLAVSRAKQAVEEAETKLRKLKHWRQRFETLTSPALRSLEPMRHQLDTTLPRAIHQLGESVKALQDYAGGLPPPASPRPSAPTTPAPAESP
jgi:glutamyl-tRNA reductase